jgi:AAA+ superfamily predicted ATPase
MGGYHMEIKLTVFFDDPFWVGVFEKEYDGQYETARVVFGSEPKDYEVYDYLIHRFNGVRFTRPMVSEEKMIRKINPKRMQRKIQQEVGCVGVGTKAQQAMKLEHELLKKERKTLSKEYREELERQRFEKRQQRKKKKKKGRSNHGKAGKHQ